MTSDYIIETRDLTKSFFPATNLIDFFSGAFKQKPVVEAVKGVNLEVKKGEAFALLGPNRAGKTTLIKILCTLILPSRGEAFIDGFDVVKNGESVRRIIGLVSGEERSFYWRLTGRQNLEFFGTLSNLKLRDIKRKIDYLVDLLDMGEYIDIRFDEYSTGMKQRLAIARSLLSEAKVLFMDEPTKSLDVYSADHFRRFIKERIVGEGGRTIFFASHNLQEVSDFADRIAFMDKGVIQAIRAASELKSKIKEPGVTVEDIFKIFFRAG